MQQDPSKIEAYRLAQKRKLEWVSGLLLLTLVIWSIFSADFPDRDLDYLENLNRFLGRFFPPDFSDVDQIGEAFLETLRIAALGTCGGVLLSIILAFSSCRLNSNEGRYLAHRRLKTGWEGGWRTGHSAPSIHRVLSMGSLLGGSHFYIRGCDRA